MNPIDTTDITHKPLSDDWQEEVIKRLWAKYHDEDGYMHGAKLQAARTELHAICQVYLEKGDEE